MAKQLIFSDMVIITGLRIYFVYRALRIMISLKEKNILLITILVTYLF